MYYGRHFRSADGEIPPLHVRDPHAVGNGVDAHASRRQRHVGTRHHREREGRGAARAEGRRHVDAHVAVVPARRALGRRRTARRRSRDHGEDRRPAPLVRRRRHAGRHRRARGRRLVGVHEPVARARRVDRASCTRSRCAICCASRRSTSRWSSRSAGTRSPTRPSSRTTAPRSTSTGTGSPRSTPASTGKAYDPGDPAYEIGAGARVGGRKDPDLFRVVPPDRRRARVSRRSARRAGRVREGRRARRGLARRAGVRADARGAAGHRGRRGRRERGTTMRSIPVV